MKITIEQNDGTKKEYEADIVAMSAQKGEKSRLYVVGNGNGVQLSCLCELLRIGKGSIFSDHPSEDSLTALKKFSNWLCKEESHDES